MAIKLLDYPIRGLWHTEHKKGGYLDKKVLCTADLGSKYCMPSVQRFGSLESARRLPVTKITVLLIITVPIAIRALMPSAPVFFNF